MPNHTAGHMHASEVLTALGLLAVAQEDERPEGELDALSGEVMHALESYRESRVDSTI
ncbi:MAG: hypothetical protein QF554_03965 [Dehalococcoidia bacterium]|nr:hypothetical protein [Dehalococcoidia bacterium]